MRAYIDRDKLEDFAMNCVGGEVSLRQIHDFPAADVRPVVRGKWEKADVQPYFRKHFDIFVCSNCHARGQTK